MTKRAKIIALAALTALALARPAFSFGIGHLSAGFGAMGAQGVGGPVAPATKGSILLVDGSSHLLQVDGVSKICIAGGC